MTALGWPTLAAALASIFAGAALLDLAWLPPRSLRRATRPARRHPRWSAVRADDARTERLLDAAGRTAVPDAAALQARRRVSAMLGGAWGGAMGWLLLPPVVALLVAAVGAAAGRALPIATLRRAAVARGTALRDEAPEVLELLAVAVGCGLPLRTAFAAAAQWSVGDLPSGLRRASADLHHGAGTVPTLDRLVREHPIAELEAAVAILERSRLHGTPAAEPLRALAAGARHARARRAMEHAARAAPRVQLVAALLLVPAALCVLAAALASGGLR